MTIESCTNSDYHFAYEETEGNFFMSRYNRATKEDCTIYFIKNDPPHFNSRLFVQRIKDGKSTFTIYELIESKE